ncbi:MAG: FtsB family cell division protein [Dissulfuribacterales bacterium]
MKPIHVKIAIVFAVLILVSCFVIIIWGDNGLRDLNTTKQKLNDLKIQNTELQRRNIELSRKVKRLKEDPEYIEDIARQELKMIGKDEVVFKFLKKEAAETNKAVEPEKKNKKMNIEHRTSNIE